MERFWFVRFGEKEWLWGGQWWGMAHDAMVAAGKNDREGGGYFANGIHGLPTVHLRHADIAQEQVDFFFALAEKLEGLYA